MTAAERVLINAMKVVERKLKKIESNSFDSIMCQIDVLDKEFRELREKLTRELNFLSNIPLKERIKPYADIEPLYDRIYKLRAEREELSRKLYRATPSDYFEKKRKLEEEHRDLNNALRELSINRK